MFQSVRAGGLAAAALAAVLGSAAPAHGRVAAPAQRVLGSVPVVSPAVAVARVPAAVPAVHTARAVHTVPAAPVAPAALALPAAPAVPRNASLEQLAAALATTTVTDADHECLANTVYFEARGEPLAGQLAVAEVVLNRANSGRYPKDICAVVKQPAQFSFVRRGQFPQANRSSSAWQRAVAISRIAKDKLVAKLPRNVLWYHADYVAPSWGKRLTRLTKIGLHIFYN